MHPFRPFSLFVLLFAAAAGFAQDTPVRYEFSGSTAEENQVTLQGAGFGAYPAANVTFGALPIDNAFDGATDGQGAVVTAKPGEGVMIFAPRLAAAQPALVRVSIRTEQPRADVVLAAIGDTPDRFVATNSPDNDAYFAGQYLRLAVFCLPPSGGFQPVLQIYNSSQSETLTAYVDNLEVYLLDPNKYYATAFLDGNEIDPPADRISIPSDDDPGAVIFAQPLDLGDGVRIEFAHIPIGSFFIGSPATEGGRRDNENNAHLVQITKNIDMALTEVTQKQWQTVMGSNPSLNATGFRGDSLPVNNVSWDDCQGFVAKLNTLGKGKYRLPTEAEWEYACRAGTTARYYWGNDDNYGQIDFYAWCYNPAGGRHPQAPSTVQQFYKNAWNLSDMSGNIAEWCQDWFGPYTLGTQTDPTGPATGTARVVRGGSYYSLNKDCRSAARTYQEPDTAYQWNGLRIVREL